MNRRRQQPAVSQGRPQVKVWSTEDELHLLLEYSRYRRAMGLAPGDPAVGIRQLFERLIAAHDLPPVEGQLAVATVGVLVGFTIRQLWGKLHALRRRYRRIETTGLINRESAFLDPSHEQIHRISREIWPPVPITRAIAIRAARRRQIAENGDVGRLRLQIEDLRRMSQRNPMTDQDRQILLEEFARLNMKVQRFRDAIAIISDTVDTISHLLNPQAPQDPGNEEEGGLDDEDDHWEYEEEEEEEEDQDYHANSSDYGENMDEGSDSDSNSNSEGGGSSHE